MLVGDEVDPNAEYNQNNQQPLDVKENGIATWFGMNWDKRRVLSARRKSDQELWNGHDNLHHFCNFGFKNSLHSATEQEQVPGCDNIQVGSRKCSYLFK